MRHLITLLLAIAIFFVGYGVLFLGFYLFTGEEPEFRARGAIFLIGPWLLAAWIVHSWPRWAKESAVGATRVALRAGKILDQTKVSASSIIEEAKKREARSDLTPNSPPHANPIGDKDLEEIKKNHTDLENRFIRNGRGR